MVNINQAVEIKLIEKEDNDYLFDTNYDSILSNSLDK